MKFIEFSEQIAATTPVTTTPGVSMTGNVAALADPKMQAANLVQQRQQKDAQKKAVQDQIKTLQTQITTLQKQLSDLNRVA